MDVVIGIICKMAGSTEPSHQHSSHLTKKVTIKVFRSPEGLTLVESMLCADAAMLSGLAGM